MVMGLSHRAGAAVALSVSPAVTSNTYPGVVMLTVTGLTNFQQVKVQTYLDLNSNGVVDPSEPLLDVFNLKESGATTVGGITNLNIPYDSNPATDTITATLSFAPPLENLTGQRIYRVMGNPASAFTPVTAVMTVTNAVLGQTVSGVVYSNGVAPLPYAVVVALTATNQNYVAGTVSDANGNYQLALSPGSYFLMPAFPGFYADQSQLPLVNLTSGLSVTNDLVLTNGTVSITGSVYDAGNSNLLGGVFLQAQSDNFFEIAFTDTNGNYFVGTTSNQWKIRISDERLARRGYLSLQTSSFIANTSSGSVSNANIGLYKGNALFYGQLTISNLPIPNVSMEANDDWQIYSSKGYTDLNGNYAVATLVNTNALPPGTTWFCSPSPGGDWTLLNRFIFNYADGVGFASNQIFSQNFAGLPTATTISGRLVNNTNAPIVGVGVGGNATIGGLQYITSFVDTDTNGNFSISTAAGTWHINANCCGNNSLQSQDYYEMESVPVTVPPAATGITLTAFPANQPQFGQPQWNSNSQFNFKVYGAVGHNYTIQSLDNLASTNWSPFNVISNMPNGSSYYLEDNQATTTAKFYRVFLGP